MIKLIFVNNQEYEICFLRNVSQSFLMVNMFGLKRKKKRKHLFMDAFSVVRYLSLCISS